MAATDEEATMKYIVTRKEVYDQGVEIEARFKEEALRLVADGEGKVNDDLFQYNRTLDTDTWTVEVAERPLRMQMIVNVEYEPGSIEPDVAKEYLLQAVRHCHDNGLFTGESEGKVIRVSSGVNSRK